MRGNIKSIQTCCLFLRFFSFNPPVLFFQKLNKRKKILFNKDINKHLLYYIIIYFEENEEHHSLTNTNLCLPFFFHLVFLFIFLKNFYFLERKKNLNSHFENQRNFVVNKIKGNQCYVLAEKES